MMKLHWSPRSPFVRKVMITAHERSLLDRLNCVRSVALRTEPNPTLMADNPLNKIPTLVLEDGAVIQDSRVICEYLDSLASGPGLFPTGNARWDALRRAALADGLLDLLLAWRGEWDRPAPLHSQLHMDAYALKTEATLDRMEAETPPEGRFDIGDVALVCALAYLDFRFDQVDWRSGRPALSQWYAAQEMRPSVRATAVVNDEAAPVAAPAGAH